MRKFKKDFLKSRPRFTRDVGKRPKYFTSAKKADRSPSKAGRKSYSTLRKSARSRRKSRNRSCRSSVSEVRERLSFTELNIHLDKIIINLSCSKYPVIPKIASEEFGMVVSNEFPEDSSWDIFWTDAVNSLSILFLFNGFFLCFFHHCSHSDPNLGLILRAYKEPCLAPENQSFSGNGEYLQEEPFGSKSEQNSENLAPAF